MMGCKGFKTRAASSANQENANFFPSLLMLERAQKLYRGAKKM
jgi:hypothetical protein